MLTLGETMDGHSILSLISLLDRIRSGWFDVICLLPAAATWSRARHLWDGQQPLRSRAEPFGPQSLDPLSMSKVTAGIQPAAGIWFLVPQRSPTKKVGVILVFPEDLGGVLDSGPTSIWASQEFKSLEGIQGGLRGAEYLCQIGDSDTHEASGYSLKPCERLQISPSGMAKSGFHS